MKTEPRINDKWYYKLWHKASEMDFCDWMLFIIKVAFLLYFVKVLVHDLLMS